jgi:hypothetical protein
VFQIVESILNTLTHFIDAHGPKVVIAVAAFVVVGIGLWVVQRVALGRRP